MILVDGRNLLRPCAIGVKTVIGFARDRRRAQYILGVKQIRAAPTVIGEIAIAGIAERGARDRRVLVQAIAGIAVSRRERRPPDQIQITLSSRTRARSGFGGIG